MNFFPETLTNRTYSDGMFLIAICNNFLWIPLAFGLWFQSWWVWFLILVILIPLTLAFFFIDSFLLAFGFLILFSLFWGAVGYMVGGFIGRHIAIAPPALIVAIFFYMITLFLFTLPLLFAYRKLIRKAKKINDPNPHWPRYRHEERYHYPDS